MTEGFNVGSRKATHLSCNGVHLVKKRLHNLCGKPDFWFFADTSKASSPKLTTKQILDPTLMGTSTCLGLDISITI